MKAGVYLGPGDIRIEDVPDAALREPTDALVRVTHAGICGSDLWVYRGELELYGPAPSRVGHEFLGVVEEVGAEVRTLRPGQLVIAPYTFSDGTCDRCREGFQTLCPSGGFFGGLQDGGQGEAVRVPLADGTLVALPPASICPTTASRPRSRPSPTSWERDITAPSLAASASAGRRWSWATAPSASARSSRPAASAPSA